jgi:hypothetical protein
MTIHGNVRSEQQAEGMFGMVVGPISRSIDAAAMNWGY